LQANGSNPQGGLVRQFDRLLARICAKAEAADASPKDSLSVARRITIAKEVAVQAYGWLADEYVAALRPLAIFGIF
jgi:hypothetical protein